MIGSCELYTADLTAQSDHQDEARKPMAIFGSRLNSVLGGLAATSTALRVGAIGALALATGTIMAPATMTRAADVAARSVADILHGRSPGERLSGALSSKHRKAKTTSVAHNPSPEGKGTPAADIPRASRLIPGRSTGTPTADGPTLSDLTGPIEAVSGDLPGAGSPVGGFPGGGIGGGSAPIIVAPIGGGGGGTPTNPGNPNNPGNPGNPGNPDNPGNPTVPGAVPEPATWLMMIFGFGLVGGQMRSRRRKDVRLGLA